MELNLKIEEAKENCNRFSRANAGKIKIVLFINPQFYDIKTATERKSGKK